MGRRKYSADTKAAVLAALLAGQAVSKVAEEFEIPVGTVKGWKYREINSQSPSAAVTQKKEAIGDMILELLGAELKTLQQMTEAFSDPKWLKEQSAADAGVLFGIIQDKVFRKLEALSRAAQRDNGE